MARNAEREKERAKRKALMAKEQARQFEDELSAHELNVMRLEAIAAPQRDAEWTAAKKAADDSIVTLDKAIETTLVAAAVTVV